MKKKDFSRASRPQKPKGLSGAKIHSSLACERGQTSIFVALIFQALFVLFAMALNIGMVVHDKINLQNSVDLAAYYAGQRQAEWLNAIAHTNYQIRQAFKLFAFRYKVMGTMGMDGGFGVPEHPTLVPGGLEEVAWPFANQPYACISYFRDWNMQDIGEEDNICRIRDRGIPALPNVAVIAGFNPINAAVAALTARIQADLEANCQFAGTYNWYWAAAAAQSFRIDQKNRIELIEAYARNLASDDPVDIRGDSIAAGAEKTMEKNLTYENLENNPTFEFYNSLSGLQRQAWLPKVVIVPFVRYLDSDSTGGCDGVERNITVEPQNPLTAQYIRDQLHAQDLLVWMDSMNSFLKGAGAYQYSLGVEKNPWYMAYVGVRAQTTSRPIFFPFGSGVTLRAEAYAKPFGGRIGPWYYSSWPRASPESVGERVDLKVPYRVVAGTDGTALSEAEANQRLPDYSKYPGDAIGLASRLAQKSFPGLRTSRSGADNHNLAWFSDIWKDIAASEPRTLDKLSWDLQNDRAPPTRKFEIAAISPDLFDITYYSIEPNYYANYLAGKIDTEKTRSSLGLGVDVPVRPDLGFRPQVLPAFSVQDQIDVAKGVDQQGNGQPALIPEAFYYVRDKAHTLTGWVSGGAYGSPLNNSEIPTEYFGRCQISDDGSDITQPGSCLIRGGITGYSVKLVNKEALLGENDQWQLGGGEEDGARGSILNPPSW